MDNNNVDNTQKGLFCPNKFYDDGNVSIGEFLTIQDAMNFPLPEIWCVNKTGNGNKFNKYKARNTRILVICNWKKPTTDPKKFVCALVFKDGLIKYFDLNDLPIDTKIYEDKLDTNVLYALYAIADNT